MESVPRRISTNHIRAELRELLDLLRRTCMVRLQSPLQGQAPMLRREAESDRDIEVLECRHLPIEPLQRVRPEAVCPAQSSANMLDAQLPEPPNRIVEPVVLIVKPLAN